MAQKDSCGIGTVTEEWRYAIETMFNVTHWPYVHSEVILDCVKGLFADSFRNLNGDIVKAGNSASSLLVPSLLPLIYLLII